MLREYLGRVSTLIAYQVDCQSWVGIDQHIGGYISKWYQMQQQLQGIEIGDLVGLWHWFCWNNRSDFPVARPKRNAIKGEKCLREWSENYRREIVFTFLYFMMEGDVMIGYSDEANAHNLPHSSSEYCPLFPARDRRTVTARVVNSFLDESFEMVAR